MNEPPRLSDLHCHLDLFANPESAFEERESMSLWTLSVTTTPRAWEQNQKWAAGREFVQVGLGLHPELVAERADEIGRWESLLPEARFVGEIGLDGRARNRPSLQVQKRIFTRMLDLCDETGGKILSVHSAGAASEVVDLIQSRLRSGGCRVVLHWFSGSSSSARLAAEFGCFFSINARMLDSTTLSRLLEVVPTERLLIESDAPFLRGDGGKGVLDDLEKVVRVLSQQLGLSRAGVVQLVHDNHGRLLG